jgi:hypothetical protein
MTRRRIREKQQVARSYIHPSFAQLVQHGGRRIVLMRGELDGAVEEQSVRVPV